MAEKQEYNEFRKIVEDIINTDSFKKMREFKKHRYTDCYEHSVNVATKCYMYAVKRNMNIDLKSLIRGALLHDFYLYDRRKEEAQHRKHLREHPSVALENARREYGDLNKIEEDIILSHMWPVNFFRFPKYKESFLVCFSDKICSIKEFFGKKDKTNKKSLQKK